MKEKKPLSPHRLSAILKEVERVSHEAPVTFSSLTAFLGDQSHGFLTLFLSVPFVLPLSLPGMSVPFGIVISTVIGAWILDLPPWLPGALRNRSIPPKLVRKVCEYGGKLFSKIEFLFKPRMEFFFDYKLFRLLLGMIIFLAAVFLALPLPPGTNFPPSAIIFVLSLSILERDGLWAILGIFSFMLLVYIFWGVIRFLLIKYGQETVSFELDLFFHSLIVS
ncbi:MAG: exopolysaccharide biosynthesis protein [Proteobacteria bacterium]|nr:exopolysaccharide biosynthesis protein [Pseudomonadota bacterium]